MMSRETPLVISEGDPYTRGQRLARSVGDRVRKTIDAYFGLFEYHAGLDRDRVLREADRFVPIIEEYAPDLLAEMRGIADGAGRDMLEIVAINARTEMLYGVTHRGECTSIAVAPEGATDARVRVGQKWDWYAWLAE